MPGGWPRYFVLELAKQDKYLRYVKEAKGGEQGHVQFSGKELISPYTKFEFEPAKDESNKGLFHIRCCYNNKYFVAAETEKWITATESEPVEDQSKWSCTLFKPVHVKGQPKKLRLRHVQLNCIVSVIPEDAPHPGCLTAEEPAHKLTTFTFMDWESLLILPKKVVFKGDNGLYLSLRDIEGHPYLTFDSSDSGIPEVSNEVFYNPNGSVRIKSDNNGKFWRRSPDWIWADSTDTSTDDKDTFFFPVKGPGEDEVALRNLGNKKFCKRLTAEGKTECLNACISTMAKEAILKVGEPVVSRSIYNVNYHTNDVRIYDKTVVSMAKKDIVNENDFPHSSEISFSETVTTTTTWKAIVSVKLGVKTKFEAKVPFFTKGEIEYSAEIQTGFEYGTTTTVTKTITTTEKVTLPPKSAATVSFIVTTGKYDVPYSYTQRDTLTNGDQVVHEMDDGVFSGSDCLDIKVESVPKPLP